MNAMSSFKKNRRSAGVGEKDDKPIERSEEEIAKELKKVSKCPGCGEQYNLFKKMGRGNKLNRTAFTKCRNCHKKEKNTTPGEVSAFSICELHMASFSHSTRKTSSSTYGQVRPRDVKYPLEHKIFENQLGTYKWRNAKAESHPKIQVNVGMCTEDYKALNMICPSSASYNTEGVTDTGAQICLFPRRELHKLNLSREDLFKVKHKILAANRTTIVINGAMLLRINSTEQGGPSTAAMVYVSPDANQFYLSKKVMKDLGVVPEEFPSISSKKVASMESVSEKTRSSESEEKEECSCPPRKLPPGKPTELLFSVRPENNERMKKWLSQRYSSSTFNTCPHQTLPNIFYPQYDRTTYQDPRG